MPKTIVLTGGGSAGHVTPNLALIPLLQEHGWDIHYIGTQDGIERSLLAGVPGVTYHAISAGKLRRYRDLRNLTDPFRVVAGCGQAGAILKQVSPRVLFSKGGFVAVPVTAAAYFRHVPVVCHESDLTPGLANRISAKFATTICTTFDETAVMLGAKGQATGAPLRDTLFAGRREEGLQLCGFSGQKPVLMMTGGGLGAQAVNECLRSALPALLPQFDIVHLCGKGNLTDIDQPGYRQFEYVEEGMPHLLASADLVLTRAGSNTIFELLALGKPHLLVPLPLSASRGDQLKNAESFAKKGYSMVLFQENMTPDTLTHALETLYTDRNRYISAMTSPVQGGMQVSGGNAHRDGLRRLLGVIEQAAR